MKNIFFILFSFIACKASAQQVYDLDKLFSSKQITAFQRSLRVITEPGKNGIAFDERSGSGLAWLNGVTFSNGTIEFDVRGRDVMQKSFVGIAFHGVNDSTYDAVYFRPFNFHAKDPIRKIHAVQYISHPNFSWDVLREKRNGEFEKALLNPPKAEAWFHVKVIVKGNAVSVFVNDDKMPSLQVNKLNDRTTGRIGLWVGEGSDGAFANLTLLEAK